MKVATKMTTKQALIGFYKFNRLNLTEEFVGCMLISLVIHVVMLFVGKTLLILEAIKNKLIKSN